MKEETVKTDAVGNKKINDGFQRWIDRFHAHYLQEPDLYTAFRNGVFFERIAQKNKEECELCFEFECGTHYQGFKYCPNCGRKFES